MTNQTSKFDTQNKDVLRSLCGRLVSFTAVCLSHYITLMCAPFHWELAEVLESDEHSLIEIIGFRGSTKTTYASLAFPLQVALTGRFKFIVIINDTTEQVKGNLFNIKTELENNPMIRKVFPNV